MLSEEVKKIIGVPDYYTDEYNSTPMINFLPVIRQFIRLFNVKSICEIGSERGLTSRNLISEFPDLEFCIIDPRVSSDLKEMASKDKRLRIFEETSLEFLRRGLCCDLYLIDGDHNFFTVKNEISLIYNNHSGKSKAPLLFFHDVSWPWGRRDMYYSPTSVPGIKDYVFDRALHLESESIVERGFDSGMVYAVSPHYGGDNNGVLTAIEKTLEERPELKFFRINCFYGLGILYQDSSTSFFKRWKLQRYLQHLHSLSALFSVFEANRLRLIQGLNEHRAELDEVKKRLGDRT